MTEKFAITKYPDAQAINKQLEVLKEMPIYSVNRDYLKEIETEYFDTPINRTTSSKKSPAVLSYRELFCMYNKQACPFSAIPHLGIAVVISELGTTPLTVPGCCV